jgi:hypothetical protein
VCHSGIVERDCQADVDHRHGKGANDVIDVHPSAAGCDGGRRERGRRREAKKNATEEPAASEKVTRSDTEVDQFVFPLHL